MIERCALLILATLYLSLLSSSAQAYLLPLIGAGGVIGTALAGIFAVLFSAAFLVYYKIRRFIRRKLGKPEEEGAEQDTQSTPDR